MPLQAKTPLVIDAIEASPTRTVASLWAQRIVIVMPNATEGVANINFHAYDETTGEVIESDEGREALLVPNLPLAIAEVPEVSAAFSAIIEAIPAIQRWQEANIAEAEAAAKAEEEAPIEEAPIEEAPIEEAPIE